MTNVKNSTYRDMPFCTSTPLADFQTYWNLKDIPHYCKILKDESIKCRTIGILQSINGRFYLSDFNENGGHSQPLVQVSVVYLKSSVPSTVIPYPVQVFGTMQWKNRAVIFAKILQVMTVPIAIRMKTALSGISSMHIAKMVDKSEYEEPI